MKIISRKPRRLFFIFFVAVFIQGIVADSNAETMLVTEDEAKQPKVKYQVSRSFFRGPEIDLISPRRDEPINGPFSLKLRFTALGGSKIDPDTLEIKYLSEPNIDITARVRALLKDDLLIIPDAVVPNGYHQFVVKIMDTSGRSSAPKLIEIKK